MSDILLHGAGGSPFVRKVRIVLAEKGLAYEHVPTVPVTDPPPGLPFPGITPELRPKTPLGKIPFVRTAVARSCQLIRFDGGTHGRDLSQ
jgi:glutathione S-transferase